MLAVFFFSLSLSGQVGINNTTPGATLDITAKTTDGSQPEGLIAPRLTGNQIQAGDAQYTAAQSGAIIYATVAATSPSGKTTNITAPGYYYYDGSVWQKLTGGSGGSSVSNTVIRRSGAAYTALSASDLTGVFTTLSLITSAPPSGFTLTSLTAADLGKTLFIQNLTGSNFSVSYTDDLSAAATYTLQNTRGAVFIWGTNGWVRGSF